MLYIVDHNASDIELLDEDENDILTDFTETEAPSLEEGIQVRAVPTRSCILASWFLMIMKTIFKLSDVVLGYFLNVVVHKLTCIHLQSKEDSWQIKNLYDTWSVGNVTTSIASNNVLKVQERMKRVNAALFDNFPIIGFLYMLAP